MEEMDVSIKLKTFSFVSRCERLISNTKQQET